MIFKESSKKIYVTWYLALWQLLMAWHFVALSLMYFNSLRPSGHAIWYQRSWPTLAQVIACCLMAPSHYLKQCCVHLQWVMWHLHESNFPGSTHDIKQYDEFEIIFSKYCSLPGTNELKHVLKMTCILWRYGSCRTTLPNGLQIALYFILVWNIGWTFSSDEVINSINICYKFYRLLDQFASHLITGTDNVHFHDI